MKRVGSEFNDQTANTGAYATPADLVSAVTGVAGLVGALAFAVAVIASHLMWPELNFDRHYISEFANSPQGNWFVIGAVTHGLGNVALGFGLRRALARSVLSIAGVVLFLIAAIGIMTAALFPTDAGLPVQTFAGVVHRIVVGLAFPMEVIAVFLFSVAFMANSYWRMLAAPSLVWALVSALAVSWFYLAVFDSRPPGFAERAALGALLLWELSVAVRLMRRR